MDFLSSERATHQVADRMLRHASTLNMDAIQRVKTVLAPWHRRLLEAGKLSREHLDRAFLEVRTAMEGAGNVVAVETARFRTHRLSSDLRYVLRFVALTADPDQGEDEHRWSDFLSAEFHLSRHEFRLRLDMLDCSMTAHALARFMQRRQAGPLDFYKGVMQPVQIASILAPVALAHGTGRIALPHRDGLLLGESSCFDVEEDWLFPHISRVTRAGTVNEQEADHPFLPKDGRIVARMRTFIDRDSLVGVKAELHDLLSEWSRTHEGAISRYFEGRAYGSVAIAAVDEGARVCSDLSALIDAGTVLVDHPVWRRFAEEPQDR